MRLNGNFSVSRADTAPRSGDTVWATGRELPQLAGLSPVLELRGALSTKAAMPFF
jgi:hypothetical protein